MPTKKKQRPLSTHTDESYESFVRGLEIFALGLTSCSCQLDRKAYFELKKSIRVLNAQYRVIFIAKTYFDVEGSFSIAIAESPKAETIVSAKCVFDAHIHGDAPILPEHAERFANSELRLILMPYARQFFTGITGQMSIPPVVLPLTSRVSVKASAKSQPGLRAKKKLSDER